MQACKTSDQGFYWEHDSSPSPVVRSFWSDARAFGVGPSGYSFPIMTERGDRLAISVCDVAERDVFMERFSGWIGDLSSLGILLADAFCRLASTNRPSSFNPTDDQLSVLRAIAMGATEEELRERDYLYGSYATVERSICALFQTSTVAQAAVLAGRVGLLDDAPLTKADVMSAQDPAVEWAAVTTQSLRKLVRLRAADPTAAA